MEKKSKNKIFLEANKAIDNMISDSEKELAREYLATLASIKLTLTEAYEKYGFFKGSFLTFKRFLKCNPFSKGGYDPVP